MLPVNIFARYMKAVAKNNLSNDSFHVFSASLDEAVKYYQAWQIKEFFSDAWEYISEKYEEITQKFGEESSESLVEFALMNDAYSPLIRDHAAFQPFMEQLATNSFNYMDMFQSFDTEQLAYAESLTFEEAPIEDDDLVDGLFEGICMLGAFIFGIDSE